MTQLAEKLHPWVASGRPADVLTADLLDDVFGLRAAVVPDPVSDAPMVVPIGTRHVRAGV